MTAEELKAWRKMVGISQSQAANILGYGRRQYQRMERGLDEIRNGIGLGCAAFALGIHKYDGPSLMAYIKDKKRKESK